MCQKLANYLPKGISDHSLLVIHLAMGSITSLLLAPWKLNAYWLNLFPSHAAVHCSIADFLATHQGQEGLLQGWDAFKAFLHGILIGQVNAVKQNSRGMWLELSA